MQLRSPLTLIHLGNGLRYLREVTLDRQLDGDRYILFSLESVLKKLKGLGFDVSLAFYENNVKELHDPLADRVKDLPEGHHAYFEESEIEEFARVMMEFEGVVLAEASTRRIAMPTTRRYSLSKLTEHPDQLFSRGVFDALPEIAKADVADGCKAIAFDLPTAAAFHLLRATEDTLRLLYCSYFVSRRNKTDRPWGSLLKEIVDKPRSPRPDDVLLSHLDHLRKRFRNPTDHPEKQYELDEAQDLLNICLDAISRVMKDERVVAYMKKHGDSC